jgi:hypothetical protein
VKLEVLKRAPHVVIQAGVPQFPVSFIGAQRVILASYSRRQVDLRRAVNARQTVTGACLDVGVGNFEVWHGEVWVGSASSQAPNLETGLDYRMLW